jgi:hypothetical protein
VKRLLFIVTIFVAGGSLSACAGGGSDDGLQAAVQAALDTRPPNAQVPDGKVCGDTDDVAAAPKKFMHFPFVHVTSIGTETGIFGATPCYMVVWDKSTGVSPVPAGMDGGPTEAVIGRMVVDKVGEVQSSADATSKMAPYTAHFEPNEVGKALTAADIVSRPQDENDGQANVHKDANDKWVAE